MTPDDAETEFRAAAARLAQVMRHHPPALTPLIESVRHLATLLAADAEVDHLEDAALTVIDTCDRSGLEFSDPAVLAAMERLRAAAADLDRNT
ncbi:hypothetical protein HTZ77_22480 [Nonomuraea sp. SMC257]|uniref:Uncharacterized protein n=1 Tax=Nonomuraea montanisoli TaxID=2741721 RepID=A0A7Y6I9K9_9ACTN|nr:hypothetical protein [Nonomuraea montanisoli]NUW34182.1 hypothetical protein [Nonomuraea montanisoli]